jgi:hypothetical protein
MMPTRAFLAACLCFTLLTPTLHAASDNATDNFNRPDSSNLGLTSRGAYPWMAGRTPDNGAPSIEGGKLLFASNRGGSNSGLGGMAATINRLKVEDVRIAFDLDFEAAPANAWFGVTWRQVGRGFDLSGYSLIIFPSGQWTLFGPSLSPILAQGTVGNRVGQGPTRVEVQSVGSQHRVSFDGAQAAQVNHAGGAYARISFISLHPDEDSANGLFRRTVDNLEIENLREFGPTFPTFRASDATTADRLNRFFRYHYGYVLNPGPVRGVQQTNWREWNAISTLWLNTAAHPSGPHDVNAELRQNLLNIPLDDEGYVFTYDPASAGGIFFPAIGWPFPTYANSGTESNVQLGRRGKAWLWDQRTDTVGWAASGHTSSTPNAPGWRVQGNGEVTVTSPAITGSGTFFSPWNPYRPMETFHSPFLALLGVPAEYEVVVNWRLQGQSGWPADNVVVSPPPAQAGTTNRYIPMHRHANWYGPSKTNRNVVQLRLTLRRPGGGPVDVTLHRLQSHYDTRHPTNNSHFVLGSARYFSWTGDEAFLTANLQRMRAAMSHLHNNLQGASLGLLEVNYVGHDGRPGAAGANGADVGRGIGSNYYDLLPFGHRDAYSTAYYLGAVKAMAEIEAWVEAQGGLGLPAPARSAAALDALATGIADSVNAYFWLPDVGRFAGTVDINNTPHDFGFTLVNLEGLHYGFGTAEQRALVYDWIDGNRNVSGDTSQGADIYAWRFAPRASTKKNSTYYNWIWPNSARNRPFGDQVQDGGTALYLSYYDIMNRLEIRGTDNAWERLADIAAWFEEVEAEGGYLEYYRNRPGTVQGDILYGDGEGGLGLHLEFVESAMVPVTFLQGFLGVDTAPGRLVIAPRLPADLEWAAVDHLQYRGHSFDVRAEREGPRIEITRRTGGSGPIDLRLGRLAPETEYRAGQTTFVTDSTGAAEVSVDLSQGQTLIIELADTTEPPPPARPPLTQVLFADNFFSGFSPDAATADLSMNRGAEGGRQSGTIVAQNPAGFGWTTYGQTSFSNNNGWDLRAQNNWPPSLPVDPHTLRFRNDQVHWSTVTPNIGFSGFFVESNYRIQAQVIHAHPDNNDPVKNDRWAGISFGAQPDVRFPASAANGGVIVYPSGSFQIFANGALLAGGAVSPPVNGVFNLDLRVYGTDGVLYINGQFVAENLDFSAVTAAWIGVTGFSENNPEVFPTAQFRFDNFIISTVGEHEAPAGYEAWVIDNWGRPIEGVTGPQDDPDGDGLVNLMEYALARDPLKPDASAITEIEEVMGTEGTRFALVYRRRTGSEDALVFPQHSSDLVNWRPASPAGVSTHFDLQIGQTDPSGLWEEIIAVERDPSDAAPRRFYRLRVETTQP